MGVKIIITRSVGLRFGFLNAFPVRSYTSDVKSAKTTEQSEQTVLDYDEVAIFEKDVRPEQLIAKMRNKSRLAPGHRNIMNEKKPYESSMEWYHDTVKYKRKMLGKYGLKALDATAGIAWPTKEEVEDAREYERVAYPVSLQDSWKQFEERKRAIAEETRLREQDIEEKLKNMGKWRAELAAKVAKKEAIEKAAREKKEKIMDEIRREYGINVDPKSPKFRELMEKKELEAKKKKKSMKKEEKNAKLLEKLTKQFQTESIAKEVKEQKAGASPENKKPEDPKPT